MGIHSHSNTTCVLLRNETSEKFNFEDYFLTNSYQIFVTVSPNTA